MLSEKEKINSNEIIIYIICSLLGIDLLNLSYNIVSISFQDAWISTLIGSLYPFSIVFIISKIIQKCDNKSLLALNKDLFGNKFGTILNLFFSLQFLLYTIEMISGLTLVNSTFIVLFIKPIRICIVVCLIVCFTVSKGFKTIIRLSIVISIGILLLLLISLTSLKNGDVLSFKPILGSGIKSILRGSFKTGYYYTTLESLLIILPYLKEKSIRSLPKKAYIGVTICTLIYAWVVFASIYQLGVGLTLKTYWPFVFGIQNITIPIVNNFRYLFLIFWNPNSIITIVIDFFIFCEIISKTFNFKVNHICIIFFPFIIIGSYLLYAYPMILKLLDNASMLFIIFNIINFILILILLNRKKKSVEN